MPVYDYKCQDRKCQQEKRDVYQSSFSAPPPEHCGLPMTRLVTAGAIPDPDGLRRFFPFARAR